MQVHRDVKVLNVEGLKNFPVKRWEVITEKVDKKKKSILKVWCDYGMEVIVRVFSDLISEGSVSIYSDI